MDDEEYKKDFPDWYAGSSEWTIISFPHRPYKENKPQHVFRKNPLKGLRQVVSNLKMTGQGILLEAMIV